ncbi:hypothetical protein R1sor_005068 [Riccia sorocarpa]|uniref:Uncharacterized protein n=1 Tax=Riccia sorocarpa TaxID=122646 RepID=A0ABD3HLG5_9MARC
MPGSVGQDHVVSWTGVIEEPPRSCTEVIKDCCVSTVGVLFFRNVLVIMAAQAGAPLHFDLYTEDDDVNYILWKCISKKKAHRVIRGIDARLLKQSGLHDVLWMDWARLEEGVRMRFSYIDNLQVSM